MGELCADAALHKLNKIIVVVNFRHAIHRKDDLCAFAGSGVYGDFGVGHGAKNVGCSASVSLAVIDVSFSVFGIEQEEFIDRHQLIVARIYFFEVVFEVDLDVVVPAVKIAVVDGT